MWAFTDMEEGMVQDWQAEHGVFVLDSSTVHVSNSPDVTGSLWMFKLYNLYILFILFFTPITQ